MPNNIIKAALEPIVKCHRQQQIRKKITLLWTALGAGGLIYAWIKQSQGWDHPNALNVFVTLWLATSLGVWIRHRMTQVPLRSIARKI